jgi:uncharacterized protein YndB with AHSA1/START domain
MLDDVTRQIGAVERQVVHHDYEGKPAQAIIATQTYDAGIDDVWDACTNPDRLPRWFLPVSGDLRVGGRYQLVGNAGGEILVCEPPRHLKVTWEYGDKMSWVEVRLSEEPDGRTTLELRHTAHADPTWEQYGPGAVGVGWDLALVGLVLHLSAGASVDPAEGMAWAGSEQGKEFIAQSSQAWCAANIAAGEDEAIATAAARRTTAFYTGAEIEAETTGAGDPAAGASQMGGTNEA